MPVISPLGWSRNWRCAWTLIILLAPATAAVAGDSVSAGKPAENANIAEAHYAAEIAGELARIDCRFVIDAKAGTTAKIPIDFGQAAVGTLKADDNETWLKGLGKGKFQLIVTGQARRTVRLQLMAKVARTDKGHTVQFAGPPAGITTLSVSLGKTGQRVDVSPRLVGPKPTVGRTSTKVTGHLTSTSKIVINWRDQPAATTGKSLITVNDHSRVRIDKASVVTHSRLRCRIDRKPAATLEFAVPKSDTVLSVTWPRKHTGVWQDRIEGERKIITVGLQKPVAGEIEVRIATRRGIKDGAATLARVETLGASRQTGLLAIAGDPRVDVAIEDAEGWTRIAAADAPETLRGPDTRYYRFANPEGALTAKVSARKPHLVVKQAVVAKLDATSAKLNSTLTWTIQPPGVSSLAVALPPNVKVTSAKGNLLTSYKVDTSGKEAVLRLELKITATGTVAIEVESTQPVATSEKLTDVKVGLLRPLGVAESTGTIEINSGRLELIGGNEGLRNVSIGELSTLSPTYKRTAWVVPTGSIRIQVRRQSRPAAQSHTDLKFDATGVAIRTVVLLPPPSDEAAPIRLLVPKAAEGSLSVTDKDGMSIDSKYATPAETEKTAFEGRVIAIPNHLTPGDTLAFVIAYRLPVAKRDDKAAAITQAFQPIVPLTTDGKPMPVEATLKIASTASQIVSLQPDQAKLVESTDSDDGDVSYTLRQPHRPLAFRVTTLQPVPQAELLIAKALIEVAVGRDSNATYRCRYRIRPTAAGRIRVDLPMTVEPLAAYINGKPIALERDASRKGAENWRAYVLDLSSRGDRKSHLELCLQFRLPLTPTAFDASFGRVRVHLPKLADAKGTAAIVENLRTTIAVPDRFALIGEPVGLTGATRTALTGLGPGDVGGDDNAADSECWIGFAPPGDISQPRGGHIYRYDGTLQPEQIDIAYADMPFATWVLGLPLLAIGLLLTRTHWQNKLSLTLLLACGVMMAAVRWGDAVYHGLLAARFGLAGVAAWWAVHAIRRSGSRKLVAHNAHTETPPCHLPMGGLTAIVIPPPGTFDAGKAEASNRRAA